MSDLLGSHVSMSGKKMLIGAAEEAASYGATAMMVYTGAPQNTRRKPIAELQSEAGQQKMAECGIRQLVVHAPYIINLANTIKPEHVAFAITFLQEEIQRATALGAQQITMHPGAHVGAGADAAIKQLIVGLNEVLLPDQIPQIALETMAGKGTEIGRSFDELARIIDGVTHNDKLSVTLDTCHIHDAGYAVREDFDGVLEQFDKIIGLDRLKVVHINDSKNEQGAAKDRHENIGFGAIGFDALHAVVVHPALSHLPKILETPYVGPNKEYAPYRQELAMLRSGRFQPQLREAILAGE